MFMWVCQVIYSVGIFRKLDQLQLKKKMYCRFSSVCLLLRSSLSSVLLLCAFSLRCKESGRSMSNHFVVPSFFVLPSIIPLKNLSLSSEVAFLE